VLIALHKPYGVLSQFTPESGSEWRTLADFGLPTRVYPIGRLDADSEGLLLLTDERPLVDRLLNPRNAHSREYWVQVERLPGDDALANLRKGVMISDYRTLPCEAARLEPQPEVPPRNPPVRFRKNVPDTWISMSLVEGKNRQVRRMTAAVGHPTLRLLRVRIGRLTLQDLNLKPGAWLELNAPQRQSVLAD